MRVGRNHGIGVGGLQIGSESVPIGNFTIESVQIRSVLIESV
jgi:hypothetical protein